MATETNNTTATDTTPTEAQAQVLANEWSIKAGEAVAVTPGPDTMTAEGSELALLRLFAYYGGKGCFLTFAKTPAGKRAASFVLVLPHARAWLMSRLSLETFRNDVLEDVYGRACVAQANIARGEQSATEDESLEIAACRQAAGVLQRACRPDGPIGRSFASGFRLG